MKGIKEFVLSNPNYRRSYEFYNSFYVNNKGESVFFPLDYIKIVGECSDIIYNCKILRKIHFNIIVPIINKLSKYYFKKHHLIWSEDYDYYQK